ncbi:MAG: serine/threonine protein kinase, partial [Deltaproteobacteria bacterium]|nr:serine/threonine protein kinase [Deltaproteobacteria bacterium]
MPTCPKCGNKYPLSFDRCPVDGEALKFGDDADPMLGQLLLDTYRIIEPLGQGGMAKVYLAENERVGRKFALKILSSVLALDADIVERFFREARTSASLRHPHIVDVVDCGTTEQNVPFMVMELLDGEDVDGVMSREGKFEVNRALDIAAWAADALEAAHSEGIVHRDIKPSNLFLETIRAGGEQLKVLDFGIVRLMGDSRLTKCGEVLGTPLYMSPEQARGDADLDHRSDVYSLGATLFHMLCGQPVFDGDTGLSIMIQHISEDPPSARKLCPELSKRHSKLIRRMLAKEPDDRPQTAGEVHKALTSAEPVRETAMSLTDTGLLAPLTMEEVRIVTVLVADIEMSASADVEELTRETRRVYETLSE